MKTWFKSVDRGSKNFLHIGNNSLSAERWMFHQEALQEYLLICCQYSKGGLIDKPGK